MSDKQQEPPSYTAEWARDTLKTLGHKPKRALFEYLSGDDLIAAKLALKVLSVEGNPALSSRAPRYAVHQAGSKVSIKVFLSPRAPLPAGLRRI